MPRKIESHFVAGPAGRLETLLEEPEDRDPVCAAVVCHPHPLHGGTMHNKVVYRLARGMRAAGAVVARFNFRGVNLSEGLHDNGVGEIDDARAVLAWLRERYPDLPYAMAGFSFGSRVALRLGCESPAPRLLIAAGFPSLQTDAAPFLDCAAPRVFVHSTHDQFGPRENFQAFYDSLRGERSLVWIESRDHFFVDALDPLEAAAKNALAAAL
ncbi:MAG: alpha/beta family hydrolase [Bryobacteraceae bacterium]